MQKHYRQTLSHENAPKRVIEKIFYVNITRKTLILLEKAIAHAY